VLASGLARRSQRYRMPKSGCKSNAVRIEIRHTDIWLIRYRRTRETRTDGKKQIVVSVNCPSRCQAGNGGDRLAIR
jgi:hypothetical protein